MTTSTRTPRGLLTLLGILLSGAAALADPPMLGELGRIGPPGKQTLIVGVDAPGFEDLAPRERALVYLLNRAAIAGDRIFTRQVHRYAPDVITLLDEIDQRNETLDPAVAAAVREELLRALVHHGPYDLRMHRKHERWGLTPQDLADATEAAARAGAHLPRLPGETTAQMLARLSPVLLDGEFEAVHVEQGKDRDMIAGSASDLYARGVTQPMIEGLLGYWQEKINVRFDLRDGRLFMQPYRIGGVYSDELKAVSHWLRKALPLAQSEEQRRSMHALLDFYTTGDEALFREHSVHWLKSDTRVDYLNGFVESYLDPRGVVGSFEANVSFRADSALVRRLAENAQYFEGKMPFDSRYRRAKVEVPVASVVNVVTATGDAGPMSAAAYNLPNYSDLRRDHGSKNVVLLNIELARSEEVRRALINEFYPPADRADGLALSDEARRWLVYMHEVIGHGSGQPDPAVKGADRVLAGRTWSALEETRADLVALYMVLDPKLVEVGAFKDARQQEATARVGYVGYLNGDLMAMRTDPELELREAHRRGYHLVTEYLVNGGTGKKDLGVRRVKTDGKTFHTVVDLKKARAGVAELLTVLQKYKSTADDRAATELFDRLGTRLDPVLREEVRRRAEPLDLPTMRAHVYPRVVPVVQDGQVVDAVRIHDEDLLTQARRYRRIWNDPAPE
ncbi:MAG: hypothetical protein HY904_16545 [Deltaproteobacteria bacterium]|nr:hypothetical protein [Deltaproteobacteria bacterium]